MATLSQDTYAAPGMILSVLGAGGGPLISSFSTFTVSSFVADDAVIGNLSTVFVSAEEAYISTISTLGIELDGNLLTTAGQGGNSELLLNGVPVATTQNISSLADWSFDPAISTVNMNNNNIIGAQGITAGTVNTSLISTTNIFAQGPETNYLLELEGATLNLNAPPIDGTQGGIITLRAEPDQGPPLNLGEINLIALDGLIRLSTNLLNCYSVSESHQTNQLNLFANPLTTGNAGATVLQGTGTAAVQSANPNGTVDIRATGGTSLAGAGVGGVVRISAATPNPYPDNSLITLVSGEASIITGNAGFTTNTTGNTIIESLNDTIIRTIAGDIDLQANTALGLAGATVGISAETHVDVLVNSPGNIAVINLIELTAEASQQGQIDLYAGPGDGDINFGIINITSVGGSDAGRIRLHATGTTNGGLPTGGEINIDCDAPSAGVDDSVINLTASEVLIRGQPVGLLEGLSTYTGGTLSVTNLVNVSTINGSNYTPGGGGGNTSTISVSSITTTQLLAPQNLTVNAGRYLLNSGTGYSNRVDNGTDVGTNSFYRVTAQNGNRGEISFTANAGFGGAPGEINLTANGGGVPGLAFGGLINITANTPLGTDPTLTSAVKISAAGINSYAGAVPSIGSLLGYNFIYGTLGVSLCAGLPPSGVQFPGTIYLYGTTGITVGSQMNTGSDITQSDGGLYTKLVTGYWAGIPYAPQTLAIQGRQTVAGNSYVTLSNVTSLAFDSGAITGLQTINGAAYPPPQPAFPTNVSCTTLVASVSVSTPSLFVSSINGVEYPPPGLSEDLVVSTVQSQYTVGTSSLNANTASTKDVFTTRLTINGGQQNAGISLQGNVSAPGISVPIFFTQGIPNTSTLALYLTNVTAQDQALLSEYCSVPFGPGAGIGNFAANKLFLSQNGGTWASMRADSVASSILVSANLSVSTLTNVSSINGAAYPPPASVGANLVVSTLTAADQISTPSLFVSSVNGAAYPPTASVGANLVVSTLTAADQISTPSLFVSSVNGAAYPPTASVGANLVVSTLTAADQISTPSLFVSSVNGAVYPPPSSSSPNGLFSTLQVSSVVLCQELQSRSTILLGDPQASTSAYFFHDANATNARVDLYLGNYLTTPGEFRIFNDSQFLAGGILSVQQIKGVSTLQADNGELNLVPGNTGSNVSIKDVAGGFGGLQVARITQLSSIYGLDSVFITSATSTLSVSSINDQLVQGPVWAAGGTYSNPNTLFAAGSNTLISYTSTTITTSTAKNMIFGTFEATTTATGTIYMTIARSEQPPTAVSSFNLTNGTSALTNAINGPGLSMWGSAFNTSRLTAYASVVDTPGAPGTYYYSLWGYDTASISTTTTELTCLTVLQVAP